MPFKLYFGNWIPNWFEIRSVARSKVAIMTPGLYSIFPKCGVCMLGFRSAGHILLLFDFCFPSVVTSRKNLKRWQKMFFYLIECSNSELLHSVQESMHQSKGQTTHLYLHVHAKAGIVTKSTEGQRTMDVRG